jgi:hypothetical protein
VLSSQIGRRSIIDNPVITEFVSDSVRKQPGREQLEESKKIFIRQLLSELFDFSLLSGRVNYFLKVVHENHDSLISKPPELLNSINTTFKAEVTEVAEKFKTLLTDLLQGNRDPGSDPLIQERLAKAALYFSDKTETILNDILDGYSFETDNKAVRKSIEEALDRVRSELTVKLACFDSMKSGFQITKYLEARAKSAVEIPPGKKRLPVSEDFTPGNVKHPGLFKILKEWRSRKAKELNVQHYQILHQKTILKLAGTLPVTITGLKQIKGIGKKKADKFGKELLEIVSEYCKKNNHELPDTEAEIHEEKKIKKPDTKKISLNLYKEGRSLKEIADERGLGITTIEGHLAHYLSTGEIPVGEFLSQEKIDLIMPHFDGSEDLKMGPVKEILGEKVTWSDLRFVVSWLKYKRSR